MQRNHLKIIHGNKYLGHFKQSPSYSSGCNKYKKYKPTEDNNPGHMLTVKEVQELKYLYHTFSSVSSGRVTSLDLISSVSGGNFFTWYIFPVTGSSLLPTHLSIRISSGT